MIRLRYPVRLAGLLLLASFALTACGRTGIPAPVTPSYLPEAVGDGRGA